MINAVSNCSSIYARYVFSLSPSHCPPFPLTETCCLTKPCLSHMYPESAGSRYVVAMSVNCFTSFIAILSATVLRFVLVHLNEKLDRGEPVKRAVSVGEAVPGEAARRGFRFYL